jgi:ElaB/YqjD/DUF883 family membrane-anchored ribosome-binding protein
MEKSNVGAESAKSSASVVESLTRTKEAIGSAASEAVDSAGSDLDALVRDLNGLKDTLATFLSKAGNEAMRSARDVSSGLADQGASMAAAAAEGGKSLTAELENMVRRNPLTSIAAAFVVGIILGRRGRRH